MEECPLRLSFFVALRLESNIDSVEEFSLLLLQHPAPNRVQLGLYNQNRWGPYSTAVGAPLFKNLMGSLARCLGSCSVPIAALLAGGAMEADGTAVDD